MRLSVQAYDTSTHTSQDEDVLYENTKQKKNNREDKKWKD